MKWEHLFSWKKNIVIITEKITDFFQMNKPRAVFNTVLQKKCNYVTVKSETATKNLSSYWWCHWK